MILFQEPLCSQEKILLIRAVPINKVLKKLTYFKFLKIRSATSMTSSYFFLSLRAFLMSLLNQDTRGLTVNVLVSKEHDDQ